MPTFAWPLLPFSQFVLFAPEKPWYQNWELWVSVCTLLLACATIWLALETRRMRKGSEGAMKGMERHAADSASAARLSAEATKTLVEIGQRPWVSLNAISVESHLTGNLCMVIGITLLNTGQTPAQEVAVRTDYYMTAGAIPEQLEFLHPDPQTTSYCLAPHADRGIQRVFPLTRAEAELLAQHQSALYAYGSAEYSDVFGHRHTTQWCSRYERPLQKFIAWPRYNKMD